MLAQKLTDYSNVNSIGSKLRRKRLEFLLPIIKDIYREYGVVNIVDFGGTKNYWNIILPYLCENKKIHITLINLPGRGGRPSDDEQFTYIEADACNLSQYRKNTFHIAHSNSVIEHVGDWSRMSQFAGEIKRVAERYFVQTPNYWFPVEPHCMMPCFHWLPKPARISLVSHFQLGHWRKAASIDEAVRIVESARLLNKKMFKELFSDAKIVTEQYFLLPKSFMAIK